MKIKNILYIQDLDLMDPENASIDVFVDVENGYNYVVEVATPKNMEFIMEKDGLNYYGPVLLVKRLTEEIMEQAIHDHAEDDGYWIQLYHFAINIKETTFQKLEAEHRKEREELNADDSDEKDESNNS